MLDHIRPQYARKFRCTGSACEENCCCGWDVVVDRVSYQKYEARPELRPLLQDRFVLISEKPSESMHAFIKYPASLVCPFLSAERLCRIQQDYGADYLCVSCATYPRVPRRIEGLLEAPLSLSCPEAARLVLLDPHLMPCEERAGEARYSRFLAMRERAISANHNPL